MAYTDTGKPGTAPPGSPGTSLDPEDAGRPKVTGPYNSRAMDVVKQSHRQDGDAAVELPQGGILPLVLRDPIVTFSEDWSPYVQVSADAAAPTALADLVAVDPRQRNIQVEVRAGYVYDDGTSDIQRLALAHLVSRRAVLPDGNMPLTATGPEQLVQDCAWLLPTTTKSFAGVREAITYLVNYGLGTTDTVLETDVLPGHRADLVSAVILEQGGDLWKPAAAIALSAGLRLYADENGTWHLAPKVALAGETAAFLVQGPGTTVRRVEDVLTRDGWYDAAVLKYTWKDSAGQEQTICGTWSPAPGANLAAGAGCKTYVSDRPGPINQFQANQNALEVAQLLATRGNSYVVESVAMYWLRPGMTVQVQLANGTLARHIVRQVAFQVAPGTMTVTTREPNNT